MTPDEREAFAFAVTVGLGITTEHTELVNDDGTVTHQYIFAPRRSGEDG